MKRSVLFLAAVLVSGSLAAQTLPELFQKAKAQVKGGAWQDAVKTLDALDVEAAKPGNDAVRAQLQGPVAFYHGVCDANLDRADAARTDFELFLNTNPTASIDPSMYSKKAVAAFAAARSNAVPPPDAGAVSSIFTAFQEFKAPPNSGELPDERWADGPMQWLLTAEEKRAWSQLSSGAERAEFIDKFWESHNPRPGTGDNTFRTGVERRIAFADANYVQDEKRRGSLTDRGMVFVLLGPPTYIGRKPIRTGDDPSDSAGLSSVGSQDERTAQRVARGASASGKTSSGQQAAISASFNGPGTRALDSNNNWREVWHYRKELLPKGTPYLQVDAEFVTKKGYGVNILQRDPQILNTLDFAKK